MILGIFASSLTTKQYLQESKKTDHVNIASISLSIPLKVTPYLFHVPYSQHLFGRISPRLCSEIQRHRFAPALHHLHHWKRQCWGPVRYITSEASESISWSRWGQGQWIGTNHFSVVAPLVCALRSLGNCTEATLHMVTPCSSNLQCQKIHL